MEQKKISKMQSNFYQDFFFEVGVEVIFVFAFLECENKVGYKWLGYRYWVTPTKVAPQNRCEKPSTTSARPSGTFATIPFL